MVVLERHKNCRKVHILSIHFNLPLLFLLGKSTQIFYVPRLSSISSYHRPCYGPNPDKIKKERKRKGKSQLKLISISELKVN